MLSVLGATLANNGLNPLTDDLVYEADIVKHTLSQMFTSGLYNYSGKF